MDIPKVIESKRLTFGGSKFIELIYKKLLAIKEKLRHENTTYTEEMTIEMTELVQLLRPLGNSRLIKVWDRCVKQDDLEMT